jgi:small nuclear ribonucleoprotein (snRNP)-like protein
MFGSLVLKNRWRDKVLVTCKSGDTFSGVLWSSDSKALVLRSAEAIGAGENRSNLSLDGEVIILFPDVAFIQRP